MNRSERRHFDKEFAKLLKTDGERCTFCHTPFEHNCKTYGGMGGVGRVVITTECCRSKVAEVHASGVFITRHSGAVPELAGRSGKPLSPEDLDKAVTSLQGHFQEVDNLSGNLMKRAGLKNRAANVFMRESAWKSDDAAWFKKHPNRSHRLRPMFDGELSTMPPKVGALDIPDRHKLEIIVRQMEVGKRIRMIFCRNIDTPIPDVEEIIHAIFDSVSQPTKRGFISVKDIAALAQQYGASNPSKAN